MFDVLSNLLRIGQVVVLQVITDAVPALVHTVWPESKKPKPCVQKIPLARVRSFRATLLKAQEGSNELAPTEHTWVYQGWHVLAILDVSDANISAGKICLTQSSMDALKLLGETDLPELDQKEPKRRTRKVSFKKASQLFRKKAAGAAAAAPAESVAQAEIGPSDIRRSTKGRQAVKRLGIRALDLDLLAFSDSPVFDSVSQECTIESLSGSGYKRKDFLDHLPLLFQYKYFGIRKPEHFGNRTFSDMKEVISELQAVPPSRKKLLILIKEAKSTKLDESIHA